MLAIAEWGGEAPAGSPLYTSAPTAGIPGAETGYSFTGIGLALTAGASYIAILTTAGVADPLLAATVTRAIGDGGLGGGFIFWDGESPTWVSWFIPHLLFTAEFAEATPVPAPPGLALLPVMLLGLGLAGRRTQPAG
ncbi:hypothetical protein [Siccirubricoccus phaeus]|uniref:hypothetical protein n=1 Tax=Siccirubricoccus phaeus TaxID=2595053 RepID=UPI0011F2C270|nr:hypothetical protein [Siccirubricoccus phaeus]